MVNITPLSALLLGSVLSLPSSASADDAQFRITSISPSGLTNVRVNAVNARGEMIGTATDSGGANIGFSYTSGALAIYPSACHNGTCTYFLPRSINRQGIVAGLGAFDMAYQFVWREDKFARKDTYALGGGQPLNGGPVINNLDQRYYVVDDGDGNYSTSYGTLAKDFGGFSGLTTSLNNRGVLAGFQVDYNGLFTFDIATGSVTYVMLPDASPAGTGVLINDAGQIAAAEQTTSGSYRGVIITGGMISTYRMPAPATYISVTGIDGNGRVVGFFADAESHVNRAFFYNGKKTFAFGSFSENDVVDVFFYKDDRIVVADSGSAGSHSYLVECHGVAC